MKRFRHILIGVDFTADGTVAPGCRDALVEGAWLAEASGARLTLVHVMSLSEDARAITDIQPQASWTRRLVALEAALENLAAELPVRDIAIKVLAGSDWQALVREVHVERHDLVVVGTRARGMAGRAIFGSTGRELLRHCPCPVWVVKPRQLEVHQNVLVAHDLSPIGAEALRLGAHMARLYGADLHVLHVQEHTEHQRLLGTAPVEALAQRCARIRAQLEEECRALGDADERALVTVLDGAPHSAILDYINKQSIDLVCMGTVARRGLAGFIPGNTAERVLRWIGCSLMAVKPNGFGIVSNLDGRGTTKQELAPRRRKDV
jgi:universal stress protein E